MMFVIAMALGGGSSLVQAQSAPPGAALAAAGASAASPEALIKQSVQSTLSAIGADAGAAAGDPTRTAAVVRNQFLPYTDFQRTARLAMAGAWAQASPAQRTQVFEQLQKLLISVYAAQLTQVGTQNIKFTVKPPAKPLPANATDAVVDTVVETNGDQNSIGYRLGKTATGWKIYDIEIVGGAWLIQIYRQQFAEQIQRGGIDGLIRFLTAHNAANAG